MSPVAVAAPSAPSRVAARRAATAPAPHRAPPRRDHLRVVSPARRARRARRPVLFAAAVTIAAVLALVVFHVLTAQSQLTLDRVSRQVDAAQQSYDAARLRNAQLSSPSRIVARAVQLGLVPPASPPVPVPIPSAATGGTVAVSTSHVPQP